MPVWCLLEAGLALAPVVLESNCCGILKVYTRWQVGSPCELQLKGDRSLEKSFAVMVVKAEPDSG